MVLSYAMVAAAALAGWSWRFALRASSPFRRSEAALLIAWAVLCAIARAVDLSADPLASVTADLLLLTATGSAGSDGRAVPVGPPARSGQP